MDHQLAGIESFRFETDGGLGQRARIGLIVLQSDQTIEHEFSRLLQVDDIALFHARIPNAWEVSRDTLRQMEDDLPRTARLLPDAFAFDAIGYACTSGATMIGEQRVEQIIHQVHAKAKISNPLTAAKAALAALGLTRIALLTPYPPDVTLEMQANLRLAGLQTNAIATFNQADDFTVARITKESILDAVLRIGAHDNCDGVFVSCTSLRALDIIATAEKQLGKPVISSNQALAWHLLRLAGIHHAPDGMGKLCTLN